MIVSPVAYRYARSLMDLARDRDMLPAVNEDMQLVGAVCGENPELILLLKSPVVKADKKEKVLNGIFAGKIGQVTTAFLGIMVRKGREMLLPQVAQAFDELYKNDQGVVTCIVTSAAPLNDASRAQVQALAARKNPGKSILLSEKLDPSLIGGVVIRIGDEQFDGSVSRSLTDLRRKFSENPYIPEI